jgi:PKD repeat protein
MWNSGSIGRIGAIALLIAVLTLVGCSLFRPTMDIDIAVSDTEGSTPMVVEFAPVVAGSVEACYWDFGDGETSIEINPVHVYRAAGTYDVFLSVILANGSTGSVEKEGLIQVTALRQKGTLTDLYWLNTNSGTIHRGDRAGYEEETIVSYIYRGRDLAVGGGYVFWAEDESIYRANYDGSGMKAIVNNQLGLRTVTVDGSIGTIYWACEPSGPFSKTAWNGGFKRANLGGADRGIIEQYDNSAEPYTWYLRADTGSGRGLYRYFDDDNYIRPVSITPKAADDGKLQYLVFVSATTFGRAQIKTAMNGITAMAVDAGSDMAYYLYWIAGSSIRRSRVDGVDVTTILRGLDTPRSVAADVVEGKMYWSDKEGIHRAALDGTDAELIYPGVRADVLVIQE